MKYLIHLLVAVIILTTSIIELNAQSLPIKTIYIHASGGLARSEDGLKFLTTSSTSQWTPMLNVGIGFRLNKYISIETHAATMLISLKAEGILVSNNETVNISARHSNIMIGSKFNLPTGKKSDIFLRTSLGLLLSQSEIKNSTNTILKKPTSNIGYMITLGYARRLSNKVIATLQFDFSDPYGRKDVWEGDMGLLNAGIIYSLNNKKLSK